MGVSWIVFAAVYTKIWRCGGLGRVVRNDVAGAQRASRVSFSAWQPVKKVRLIFEPAR
jgi:hypothetical protein